MKPGPYDWLPESRLTGPPPIAARVPSVMPMLTVMAPMNRHAASTMASASKNGGPRRTTVAVVTMPPRR